MYESPIKIIHAEINMQMEGEILKAVQRFGVDVDKKELLKALEYDRDSYKKGYEDGRNENRWIPCSERLPEHQEEVLITIFKDSIYIGWYELNDKQWCTEEFDCEEGEVIAWMPLPEPYKGE